MFEKAQASGFRKRAAFAPASQKRLDSRLRSPLPFVEEPCPLSLPYGFLHPLTFTCVLRGTVREWRKKSEGSDAISVYFTNEIIYTIPFQEFAVPKRGLFSHFTLFHTRRISENSRSRFFIRLPPGIQEPDWSSGAWPGARLSHPGQRQDDGGETPFHLPSQRTKMPRELSGENKRNPRLP